MPQHVAHVDAPGQRQRHGQHFKPERAVEPEGVRGALAPREEQGSLLAADRDDRDNGDAELVRQREKALAVIEVDGGRGPRWPVRFIVAYRRSSGATGDAITRSWASW